MNLFLFLPFLVILLITSYSADAQPYDYPIANVSTSWINNNISIKHSVDFTDGSMVRSILLQGSLGPRFACGFYCNGNCTRFIFAVFIVQTNSASLITYTTNGFPQVVWSVNNPVQENATLELTREGNLVLRDVDQSLVWSTNTTGKSVLGMNMTEMGNLVLFDSKNNPVWQSFDHPTDSLVPLQTLVAGQKLTASSWTGGVILSLSVTTEGLFASVESDSPQIYYESRVYDPNSTRQPSYVKFINGSLALFILSAEPNQPDSVIPVPLAMSMQYMKLGRDGHLRVYEWDFGWKEVADLLTGYFGECQYPTVCGKHSLCSNSQCSCLGAGRGGANYFRQLNERQPNLGCSEITPLSCEAPEDHRLLDLTDVTYFYYPANLTNTDMESCKEACLKNCSCKAAIFRYGLNDLNGECYMPSEVFSLMNNEKDKTHYNSSVFIKVQMPQITVNRSTEVSPTPAPSGNKRTKIAVIVGSSLGTFVGVVLIISISLLLFRKKRDIEKDEEYYLDQVPGMPTRFCYEDLKAATEDFDKKLGEGGFGSVFGGTLLDGTKIAVKCLDGIGQVKKSFLAEVETIGSIHHVNLVRLVGFCADKTHRLLVYEYMCNGSLEKWIFKRNEENSLGWETRRIIILNVAKGLTYLHEECRQRILHLDIKPQNILLDEDFNAKVSDFGLAKLIDRDQIQVMTTMRGTPGYLAPEWLNSVITEKVDVYSFGVVVMEIICGRKNLDRNQPEESMHLLSLFKQKVEEDRLLDIIDKHSEDVQLHREEAMDMLKVAAWCLQSDFNRRPSMSIVVKVLEGVMEVESNLDYSFSSPPSSTVINAQKETEFGASTPLLPSVLSGPR